MCRHFLDADDPSGPEPNVVGCLVDSIHVGTMPEGEEDLVAGHEDRAKQQRRPDLARPAYGCDRLIAMGDIRLGQEVGHGSAARPLPALAASSEARNFGPPVGSMRASSVRERRPSLA